MSIETLPDTERQAALNTAITVETTVNGRTVTRRVEARRMLLDFLRDDLGLKGAKRSLRFASLRRLHRTARRTAGQLLLHPRL